jgi:steroid 5-alpha reductase family enzyme
MRKKNLIPTIAVLLSLLVGAAVAWAGSHGSALAAGVPVFALCGAIAFVVNWLAFVPAYFFQTEHYYDLTGSLTYLTLVAVAFGLSGPLEPRALLLGLLVVIWAVRLGSFLFLRIRKDGSDGRFDRIKPSFARFLMAWTLQGLWVFLTLSCALAAITSSVAEPLGTMTIVGAATWLTGFSIEVVADRQKRRFRTSPEGRGRFITTGLWAWSRHPNYFGEITLWIGIALIALPALSGWQLVTLISPIFVFVLLTRISGVPLLEARADERWGGEADYEAYKSRTPVLFPIVGTAAKRS